MASYIYMQNLNEISQGMFNKLYGKIKTQHETFIHGSVRSP